MKRAKSAIEIDGVEYKAISGSLVMFGTTLHEYRGGEMMINGEPRSCDIGFTGRKAQMVNGRKVIRCHVSLGRTMTETPDRIAAWFILN